MEPSGTDTYRSLSRRVETNHCRRHDCISHRKQTSIRARVALQTRDAESEGAYDSPRSQTAFQGEQHSIALRRFTRSSRKGSKEVHRGKPELAYRASFPRLCAGT